MGTEPSLWSVTPSLVVVFFFGRGTFYSVDSFLRFSSGYLFCKENPLFDAHHKISPLYFYRSDMRARASQKGFPR